MIYECAQNKVPRGRKIESRCLLLGIVASDWGVSGDADQSGGCQESLRLSGY